MNVIRAKLWVCFLPLSSAPRCGSGPKCRLDCPLPPPPCVTIRTASHRGAEREFPANGSALESASEGVGGSRGAPENAFEGAPGNRGAPESAREGALPDDPRPHRKSTLESTFWSTPISRSTLKSTFRSTPISHSTLRSTFQSTSRGFRLSNPVAGRPDSTHLRPRTPLSHPFPEHCKKEPERVGGGGRGGREGRAVARGKGPPIPMVRIIIRGVP